jgi:hypothetical protein
MAALGGGAETPDMSDTDVEFYEVLEATTEAVENGDDENPEQPTFTNGPDEIVFEKPPSNL